MTTKLSTFMTTTSLSHHKKGHCGLVVAVNIICINYYSVIKRYRFTSTSLRCAQVLIKVYQALNDDQVDFTWNYGLKH